MSFLTSVADMIDNAFIEEARVINFKIIQMTLLVLAKQTRALERQVAVAMGIFSPPSTRLSISETTIIGKKTDQSTKDKKETAVPAIFNLKIETVQPLTDKKQKYTHTKMMKRDSQPKLQRKDKESKKLKTKSSSVSQQTSSDSLEELLKPPEKSIDYDKEKLFVVSSSTASDEDSIDEEEGSLKSIVTMQQFQQLVARVIALQKLYGEHTGDQDFLISEKLSEEFTLSDPMAILQMSERLKLCAKLLKDMLNLVYELAWRHVSPKEFKKIFERFEEIPEIFVPPKRKYFLPVDFDRDLNQVPQWRESDSFCTLDVRMILDSYNGQQPFIRFNDLISYENFVIKCQEFYENFLKNLVIKPKKTLASGRAAIIEAKSLIESLNNFEVYDKDIDDIEILIETYASKVTSVDTEITEMVTGYQEELSAMKFNLDEALEHMAESATQCHRDPEATEDFKDKLNMFEMELHHTNELQNHLSETQQFTHTDILALNRQLDILNLIKADRDEVEEAFECKASIHDLNHLLQKDYFDAVYGNFEEQLIHAYAMFNGREISWQVSIDNLFKKYNGCADVNQIEYFRHDILTKTGELNKMANILLNVACGPVDDADLKNFVLPTVQSRHCISCFKKDPRILNMSRFSFLPPLSIGREDKKPLRGRSSFTSQMSSFSSEALKEAHKVIKKIKKTRADNLRDHKKSLDGRASVPCYPGKPIPHPIDPRSKVCSKICGGRLPKIRHPKYQVFGQSYKKVNIPKPEIKKPCIPCNETIDGMEYSPIPSISVPSEAILTAPDLAKPQIKIFLNLRAKLPEEQASETKEEKDNKKIVAQIHE